MMKKFFVLLLSAFLVFVGVSVACAAVQAKDALIAYVGTEAFMKLSAGERQACVEWLAESGTMGPDCKKAVMKLVSLAPGAVTLEQRQALVLAASDSVVSVPGGNSDTPVIVENKDDTTAVIVGGLVGLLAGLVIANNTRHHHYGPAPHYPRPPYIIRPPRRHIGGPIWKPKMPPHRRVHVNAAKRPPKGGRPPRR